ncbi:MAG: hypothetical protein BAJATHORv1_70081 [Candidatus Thorarchaeota archaeon]|nr:MAG: hypothetical protein BAJATHORv1_70081 [Candidatus Thorarchaeota archaeon]
MKDCLIDQQQTLTETPMALLSKMQTPFALQLHVTEQCNKRCKHCYSDSWTRNMSFDDFMGIIKQFKRLLRFLRADGTVYLTGGEPLLWRDLLKAIRVLVREGIAPRVFTNGTLMTGEFAKELKRAGTRYVQVSLDGGPDLHDSIRGEGSFEKAVRGIRYLVGEGIEVTVMVTVMKRNLRDVDSLIAMAEELGVSRIAFGRLVPIGNGSELTSDDLSREDVRELFSLLERRRGETQIEIVQRDPLWSGVTCSGFEYSGCSAGQFLLDILVDGTILPCRRLPIPVGNVFENELLDIFVQSPLLRHLRNRGNLECASCEKIRQCGGCRGVAYAATGNIDARDPHCFFGDADSLGEADKVVLTTISES